MKNKHWEEINSLILKLKTSKIDFLNFCYQNLEFIMSNSIKEIGRVYGCGMSFIYNFLQKLNLNSINEFRNFLQIKYFKSDDNKLNWNSNFANLINEVLLHTNFLFEQQLLKVDEILSSIFKAGQKVFFCGLGYSNLGAYDLFALKMYLPNLNWIFLNEKNNQYVFNELEYTLDESIFLFYSLSGKSKSNLTFIEKLKVSHKKIKVFLVTGNHNYNSDNIDLAIVTANAMKINNVWVNKILLSPTFDFALFNNFIKTRALHLFSERFFNSENFKEEFSWWDKKSLFKKMSF